jgi:hypothetical protein
MDKYYLFIMKIIQFAILLCLFCSFLSKKVKETQIEEELSYLDVKTEQVCGVPSDKNVCSYNTGQRCCYVYIPGNTYEIEQKICLEAKSTQKTKSDDESWIFSNNQDKKILDVVCYGEYAKLPLPAGNTCGVASPTKKEECFNDSSKISPNRCCIATVPDTGNKMCLKTSSTESYMKASFAKTEIENTYNVKDVECGDGDLPNNQCGNSKGSSTNVDDVADCYIATDSKCCLVKNSNTQKSRCMKVGKDQYLSEKIAVQWIEDKLQSTEKICGSTKVDPKKNTCGKSQEVFPQKVDNCISAKDVRCCHFQIDDNNSVCFGPTNKYTPVDRSSLKTAMELTYDIKKATCNKGVINPEMSDCGQKNPNTEQDCTNFESDRCCMATVDTKTTCVRANREDKHADAENGIRSKYQMDSSDSVKCGKDILQSNCGNGANSKLSDCMTSEKCCLAYGKYFFSPYKKSYCMSAKDAKTPNEFETTLKTNNEVETVKCTPEFVLKNECGRTKDDKFDETTMATHITQCTRTTSDNRYCCLKSATKGSSDGYCVKSWTNILEKRELATAALSFTYGEGNINCGKEIVPIPLKSECGKNKDLTVPTKAEDCWVKEKNCCYVKKATVSASVCILANSEKEPKNQVKNKNEETLYEKFGWGPELIVCSAIFPKMIISLIFIITLLLF